MRELARRLAHEPLAWFVAIGGLLFAGDRLLVPRAHDPRRVAVDGPECTELTRHLVVGPEVIAELRKNYQRAAGRLPTDAELEPLLDTWIDEQIFYREGRALGLDRDDGVIRRRVADKMAFILSATHPVEAPSESELRAYFEAHAEQYAQEPRLDFQHVFFDPADEDAGERAAVALERLRAGASAAGLGDRFSGGRRYRQRTVQQLGEIFGAEFVEGLDVQPLGIWTQRVSKYGVHLVQVTARAESRGADFELDRLRIEQDWVEEREAEAAASARASLRAKWTIERP